MVGVTVLCAKVVLATPLCAVTLHNGKLYSGAANCTKNRCCTVVGQSHMNGLVRAISYYTLVSGLGNIPWYPP